MHLSESCRLVTALIHAIAYMDNETASALVRLGYRSKALCEGAGIILHGKRGAHVTPFVFSFDPSQITLS